MNWRASLREWLVPLAASRPPSWTFAVLDLVARGIDVKRLPTALKAADALGLDGPARDAFCRRAWVGTKASEVVWSALETAGATGLLVGEVDLATLEAAAQAGRGVVLAAAHIGPQRVLATYLRERFPDTLFLLHEPGLIVGPAHTRFTGDGANHAAALLEATRVLKKGGLVYIAPDGVSGPMSLTLPLSDGHVRMSRGAATLARLSGAAAVPVAAMWFDRRIKVFSGPPIDVPAAAPEEWERAWLARYLAEVEHWTRDLPPENLRLHGSLYERWMRG